MLTLADAFILGFAIGAATVIFIWGLYRCTVGHAERGM